MRDEEWQDLMGLVSEENGLEMACDVERENMRMRNGKDGERCEGTGGWPCTHGSCACKQETGMVIRKGGVRNSSQECEPGHFQSDPSDT